MSISTDAPTSGTASIAFVDCEISAGVGPTSGGGVHTHAHRRWEVVIAGKRVKTVDVHAHCIVPDAAKVINHPLEAPGAACGRMSATASRTWTSRASMSRHSASTRSGTAPSATRPNS